MGITWSNYLAHMGLSKQTELSLTREQGEQGNPYQGTKVMVNIVRIEDPVSKKKELEEKGLH